MAIEEGKSYVLQAGWHRIGGEWVKFDVPVKVTYEKQVVPEYMTKYNIPAHSYRSGAGRFSTFKTIGRKDGSDKDEM